MSLFDETPALSPVQFFAVTTDCFYLRGSFQKPMKEHLLPSTSDLLGESSFADVYVAWSTEKLSFLISVHSPFQKIVDLEPTKGDAIELFIDTRDLKTKGTISRFCHHFVFFPVLSQNFYGREITRFRNDDMHPLCHPEDLHVVPSFQKDGYQMIIEIPAESLHGYDPLSFSRLGFTYRISRAEGACQHFAVSSEEYVIEQHPATWGTLRLQRE